MGAHRQCRGKSGDIKFGRSVQHGQNTFMREEDSVGRQQWCRRVEGKSVLAGLACLFFPFFSCLLRATAAAACTVLGWPQCSSSQCVIMYYVIMYCAVACKVLRCRTVLPAWAGVWHREMLSIGFYLPGLYCLICVTSVSVRYAIALVALLKCSDGQSRWLTVGPSADLNEVKVLPSEGLVVLYMANPKLIKGEIPG